MTLNHNLSVATLLATAHALVRRGFETDLLRQGPLAAKERPRSRGFRFSQVRSPYFLSPTVTTYDRRGPDTLMAAQDKRVRKALKRVRDQNRCAHGQLARQPLRGLL